MITITTWEMDRRQTGVSFRAALAEVMKQPG